ncbi:MAG: RdgB/HAM1 family non-canonical purine NTP pyrophosphatase [Actinomycetota bacterium]
MLGTANLGKIAEIIKIMDGLGLEFVTKDRMPPWPNIVESGHTYLQNALIKAHALREFSGMAVLADDSGIEIDALNGAPGVRSARFAGPRATDEQNNLRMAYLLRDEPEENRTARYRCVAIFVTPQGEHISAEATCEGAIAQAPRGGNGFGYDPWFVPQGQTLTFGELSAEFKDSISHRGKAFRALAQQLTTSSLI